VGFELISITRRARGRVYERHDVHLVPLAREQEPPGRVPEDRVYGFSIARTIRRVMSASLIRKF